MLFRGDPWGRLFLCGLDPHVVGSRADEAVGFVLFEDVTDPAHGAAEGKKGRGSARGKV